MERKTFKFKNKSALFWQQQAPWGIMDAGNPAVWSTDRTKQLTASKRLPKDEGHSQLYTCCSAAFIKTAAFQGVWAEFFSSPAWIQHLRKLLECFQMLKKVHKIIQMLLSPQMGLKTAIHGIRSPLSNSNSLISTVNNIGSALVTLLSEMGPEHCWFIRHLYSIFFCLFVLFCPGFQSKRRSSFFFITTFPVAFPGVLLKG